MPLRSGHLILTAILLSGILTSCGTFGNGKERQALLDHYLKLDALAEAAAQGSDHILASSSSNTESVNTNTKRQTDVILPLGDPQPMVDEIGLAPEGPSKPFAADPVDEVGLFPED